jgi:hypothetical protein
LFLAGGSGAPSRDAKDSRGYAAKVIAIERGALDPPRIRQAVRIFSESKGNTECITLK